MKAIEIKNLKKSFGNVRAIDTISLDVEKGQIFGFLGPNGAGKTTTIRLMMDFIRPDGGTVEILGKDAQKDETELKRDIGYLSGEVHLYQNWTGEKHIAFIKKLNGEKDISSELIDRLNFDVTKKAKHLSSGNKQKLGLILAFMSKPRLVILDEPTVGLDPILQNEVYTLINETVKDGATVFMSSHNLPEVERVCDHVGIIKEGNIIARESIASIKKKKIYTVRASFKDAVAYKEFLVEGDRLIQKLDDGFIIQLKSNIDTFVKKASKYDVHDIDIVQASLEDIFLEYYEK